MTLSNTTKIVKNINLSAQNFEISSMQTSSTLRFVYSSQCSREHFQYFDDGYCHLLMIHLGSLFSVNFPSIATTFISGIVSTGDTSFVILEMVDISLKLLSFFAESISCSSNSVKSVDLCLSSWRFFSDRFVTQLRRYFHFGNNHINILILKIDDAMKHPTTMDAAMTENSFSRSGYLLSEIAQVHPSNVEF